MFERPLNCYNCYRHFLWKIELLQKFNGKMIEMITYFIWLGILILYHFRLFKILVATKHSLNEFFNFIFLYLSSYIFEKNTKSLWNNKSFPSPRGGVKCPALRRLHCWIPIKMIWKNYITDMSFLPPIISV